MLQTVMTTLYTSLHHKYIKTW